MKNMENLCRLCLKLQKKGNLSVNIFEDGSENISGFIYDIFQVHVSTQSHILRVCLMRTPFQLEEVTGWPSEACKKCERLIIEIRSFREEVLLAQSTLSDSVVALDTAQTTDPVDVESVKNEEEMVEISQLPEVYFEDSEAETQDVEFCDTMKEEDTEVKTEKDDFKATPTKNRRNKKLMPNKREQPRRSSKKEVIQKRTAASPYSLDQERKMELQMQDMGWFKCCICSEEQTCLKELQQHFRAAHNAFGYILCCNGKRMVGTPAYEHLIYHQNPSAFECPVCKKVFRARTHVRLHVREQHGGPDVKTFKCHLCVKTFSSKGKLTGHIKTHVRPEKCSYCGKGGLRYVNNMVGYMSIFHF